MIHLTQKLVYLYVQGHHTTGCLVDRDLLYVSNGILTPCQPHRVKYDKSRYIVHLQNLKRKQHWAACLERMRCHCIIHQTMEPSQRQC